MGIEAAIVFPNQLFEENPLITEQRTVFLQENPRYFTDFKYHKQKLILHRASMKAYQDKLVVGRDPYPTSNTQGVKVVYLNWNQDLLEKLREHQVEKLFFIDPVDTKVEKELLEALEKCGIESVKLDNPGFLTSNTELGKYFGDSEKFAFTPFYINQRKRLKILVNKQNKPHGGKWSFDPENRRKIPTGQEIPELKKFKTNKYIEEARDYVNKNFPNNPGNPDNFIYPVTHSEAMLWFEDFLEHRFYLFGDYEDAIKEKESFLFHSAISFALNSGLITPSQVVEKTLDFILENPVEMNSLEGFIRQVIGWREYIRAVYLLKEEEERCTNYFEFSTPLPQSFYDGTTGVLPVDVTIRKLLKTAYTHHIERLMVLGNFMLLCEISPNEVYRWFMELYIDAYDWVMVPNIYGMSQFADGGMIMTKPYISSSNYIKKMSDFKDGKWCEIWDALYWRFILKHIDIFEENPRSRLMVRVLERKTREEVDNYVNIAEDFLKKL